MKRFIFALTLLSLLLPMPDSFAQKANPKGAKKNTHKEAVKTNEEPVAPHNTFSSSAENYSKWQVGAELLGAGFFYSAFSSYRFTPNIAANLGLSLISTSNSSGTATLFQVPVSFSYLAGGNDSFFEALGGFDFLFASLKLSGDNYNERFSRSNVVPEIGLGYRYWPAAGGFHFRATLYGIIAGGFLPWFGLSFGYAFAP